MSWKNVLKLSANKGPAAVQTLLKALPKLHKFFVDSIISKNIKRLKLICEAAGLPSASMIALAESCQAGQLEQKAQQMHERAQP